MGGLIRWWCELIGITDPAAVSVATGTAGGVLFVVVLVLAVFVALAWAMVAIVRR